MIPVSRDFNGAGRHRSRGEFVFYSGADGQRPGSGGAPRITAPLPASAVPGTDMPFSGMDPSNPLTWVRPWNPASGMVARLNFDGAQAQAHTPMGGTWTNPAKWGTQVAARPARRIR